MKYCREGTPQVSTLGQNTVSIATNLSLAQLGKALGEHAASVADSTPVAIGADRSAHHSMGLEVSFLIIIEERHLSAGKLIE